MRLKEPGHDEIPLGKPNEDGVLSDIPLLNSNTLVFGSD